MRWIKYYEKITEWEWYDDSHMVHLFGHLIVKAEWRDCSKKGIDLKKGQLITTVAKLSGQTGISVKGIRTCLSRLVASKEIITQTTNKYTIISVINYKRYQGGDDDEGQTEGQTSGKQTANNGLEDTEITDDPCPLEGKNLKKTTLEENTPPDPTQVPGERNRRSFYPHQITIQLSFENSRVGI